LDGFEVEIEPRRKLGLPAEVLAASGLRPGQRMLIQVRRDGRLAIVPMAELLDKYAGAIPGLTKATELRELRDS
jgi:bifunctional DNA-binding transcriptional regulator/antitoxin component of YhaV-PrlF toxin-antitoxin module